MLALASLPAHLGMGWVEWGGTTVALHRPHGSQGCTPHLRARAVSERLARARLADSWCALAFARKREGGRLEKQAGQGAADKPRVCSAFMAVMLWLAQLWDVAQG